MFKFKRKIFVFFLIMLLSLSVTACSDTNSPPEDNAPGNIPEENNFQSDGEHEEEPEKVDQETKELIVEIMELVKEGKVIGCEFIAGKTVFDEVEKKWGKADKTDYVADAKGTYATYSSKGFVFGINKVPKYLKSGKLATWNILPSLR